MNFVNFQDMKLIIIKITMIGFFLSMGRIIKILSKIILNKFAGIQFLVQIFSEIRPILEVKQKIIRVVILSNKKKIITKKIKKMIYGLERFI